MYGFPKYHNIGYTPKVMQLTYEGDVRYFKIPQYGGTPHVPDTPSIFVFTLVTFPISAHYLVTLVRGI